MTYARLAVCAVTSYGYITLHDSKDTAYLVAHLTELERQMKRHTGRNPTIIRMDFGSEAFMQGHGGVVLVSAAKSSSTLAPACV